MKKYVCEPCGYVYDPEVGDPDGGIAPGTAFEDIPDDWVCPICGMGKDVFVPKELSQPERPECDSNAVTLRLFLSDPESGFPSLHCCKKCVILKENDSDR